MPVFVLVLVPLLVLVALLTIRGEAPRPQLGNEKSWLSEDEIQGFCSFEEAATRPSGCD